MVLPSFLNELYELRREATVRLEHLRFVFRRETDKSAINSAKIWMLLAFLSFRCWTASRYCPFMSFSMHSFLLTVFQPILALHCQWREPPKRTHPIRLKSKTDIEKEHVNLKKGHRCYLCILTTQMVKHVPKLQQHGPSTFHLPNCSLSWRKQGNLDEIRQIGSLELAEAREMKNES